MQGRLLFLFATLIGLFSYSVLVLGLLGSINKISVLFVTIVFFGIIFYSFFKHPESVKSLFVQAKKNLFYFSILFGLALINFVGMLGPELGFDALWYHLVIPKLYVASGAIEFIPNGLLYYSVMPKLIDILYIPALMFSDETTAKFIHFLFGLLATIGTYKIANLFLDKKLSYLAAVIFYSNLVVGWLSITAYIDLGRTFFATLSIYFFLQYFKLREPKYLFASSILVGLEISTKLLGFSTLISLFIVLLIFSTKATIGDKIKNGLLFLVIPILINAIWFIFAYVNTGNAFYPFFSEIYPSKILASSISPIIMKDTLDLFLFSADPISPIYLIVTPLLILMYKKMSYEIKIICAILVINLLIWNFIPQKNSRFFLPYLPLFSALVVWVISVSRERIKKTLLVVVYLTIIVNLVYRGVANFKYLPVILGLQTKEEFLVKYLNFDYGDYIDVGSSVKKIVGENRVLVKNIHNLYYVDFPFDHESWERKINYKYILIRGNLNNKKGYNLVYSDPITNTYLYESDK